MAFGTPFGNQTLLWLLATALVTIAIVNRSGLAPIVRGGGGLV